MTETINVIIVDDHLVVREGISSVLDYADGIEVIGQASNAEEALDQINRLSPDIILMDLRMPGVDGIQLTRTILRTKPHCKIIILTLYDQFVSEAVAAGASGYLLKDISGEELISAIKQVYGGETVFDKKVKLTVNVEYETPQLEDNVIGQDEEKQSSEKLSFYEQIKIFMLPPTSIADSLKITSIAEEALAADFKQVEGTPSDGIGITFNLYTSNTTKDIIDKLSSIPSLKVFTYQELSKMENLQDIIKSKQDYDLRHPLVKTIFAQVEPSES